MDRLRIGLAAVRWQPTIGEGLEKIEEYVRRSAENGVDIVCFPETYLPGLRGSSFDLPEPDQSRMEAALAELRGIASRHDTAAIVGMEWVSALGLENRAYVLSREGRVLGYQTKNQITPGGESEHYVPDGERTLFEIDGVPFGIVVCHEGWRYPETVRWAATRGAKVVFQPQVTSRSEADEPLDRWGSTYYEKAMICRTKENSIYFASVNLAMEHQNSATTLVDPEGTVVDFVPYGDEALLVSDLDPDEATGYYAEQYDPGLYPD